jgi:hypothetical protein
LTNVKGALTEHREKVPWAGIIRKAHQIDVHGQPAKLIGYRIPDRFLSDVPQYRCFPRLPATKKQHTALVAGRAENMHAQFVTTETWSYRSATNPRSILFQAEIPQ